jgi:hypothetical protein
MDPPNLREPDSRHRQRVASKSEAILISHSRLGRVGFIDPTSVKPTRAVYGSQFEAQPSRAKFRLGFCPPWEPGPAAATAGDFPCRQMPSVCCK